MNNNNAVRKTTVDGQQDSTVHQFKTGWGKALAIDNIGKSLVSDEMYFVCDKFMFCKNELNIYKAVLSFLDSPNSHSNVSVVTLDRTWLVL